MAARQAPVNNGGWEDVPSAPSVGGWEDTVGGLAVAPPPSAEELRAQKYGTVSPAELRAQHQANYEYENPNLLQSASRMAEGFTQGVGNLVTGLGSLGKQVYDIAKAPAASMQNFTNVQNPGPMARLGNTLAGMGPADLVASLGTQAGKYIYGTPEEAGEVLGENLPALAAPELSRAAARPIVGAVNVVKSFTPSARAAMFSERATNQLVAGLQPKTLKVPNALKAGSSDLHEYISTTGKGKMWEDSRGFSKVANAAADDFYKKNYQPLADDIAKVDPTVAADLERRSVINKTLGRLGYFDKSPMVKAMARTSPQVGALAEELDALKSSLNARFDAMAPTNAGAANILRRYSNLKEIADRAATQADRIELAKMINAGEEGTAMENLMGWAKDAGVTAATLGAKPALFSRWWNILKSDASKTPLHELDTKFAQAAQNWQKGARAFKGAHQPIVRTTPPLNRQLPAAPDTSGIVPTNPADVALSPYGQRMLPPAGGTEVIPSSGQTLITEPPASFTAAEQFRQLPNVTTVPQQRMLPPATGQTVQPTSGQVYTTPAPPGSFPAPAPRQIMTPSGQTGVILPGTRGDYVRIRLNQTGAEQWIPQRQLTELPETVPQPPTISPVPQPPPISGGSTGYPANTNPITGTIAGSAETPAQAADRIYNERLALQTPQTPPPISVPSARDLLTPLEERRTMDRIQSGYAGEERRAPQTAEVPESFKGKITDYKNRQKGAAIYRKMSERRKSPR